MNYCHWHWIVDDLVHSVGGAAFMYRRERQRFAILAWATLSSDQGLYRFLSLFPRSHILSLKHWHWAVVLRVWIHTCSLCLLLNLFITWRLRKLSRRNQADKRRSFLTKGTASVRCSFRPPLTCHSLDFDAVLDCIVGHPSSRCVC